MIIRFEHGVIYASVLVAKKLLIGLGAIFIISGLVQYHAPEFHHSRRHRFVWELS